MTRNTRIGCEALRRNFISRATLEATLETSRLAKAQLTYLQFLKRVHATCRRLVLRGNIPVAEVN